MKCAKVKLVKDTRVKNAGKKKRIAHRIAPNKIERKRAEAAGNPPGSFCFCIKNWKKVEIHQIGAENGMYNGSK